MSTNQRAKITMSADEIATFLQQQRSATIATLGPAGFPHLVAMWYAMVDGAIWFETKAKSQKVVNLRRDDKITFLAETGDTYDALRGVAIEGRARISDDADELWAVAVSVFNRYMGEYTDEMQPLAAALVHNRVGVKIEVERIRSWDHRKMGMGAVPLGGSTAQYLGLP
jgi:PPOX class probable F420-dependent enzyme